MGLRGIPKQPDFVEIPKQSDLVDFKNAVAGHAGTMCDPKGALFIKPCTQAEIDFYEAARAEHPRFADLMPTYMGTLELSSANAAISSISQQLPATASADAAKQDLAVLIPNIVSLSPGSSVFDSGSAALAVSTPSSTSASIATSAPTSATSASTAASAPVDNETWVPRGSLPICTDRAIVLENATYGYKKPNVLDVKLGQRLWADDAPRQKRVRLDTVRAETTHDKLGFRIAGMRVYCGKASAAAADPDGNPAGDALPDKSQDTDAMSCTDDLDESGYRVYDKDFGRYQVNDDNVVDAFRRFLANSQADIDSDIGRAIALAFKTDLERVRDIMEKECTRMYSSSLLFVFEGDPDALRAAVRVNERLAAAVSADAEAAAETDAAALATAATATANAATPTREVAAGSAAACRTRSRRDRCDSGIDSKPGDRSASRTDSGIVMEDDDSAVIEPAAAGAFDEDDYDEDYDEDDEDDDDAADSIVQPPICGVRLIDFAHAKFVPEEASPDENSLVGVRSLIRIFDELSK